MSYSYFAHKTRTDYRLVTPTGAALPPGLDPADWMLVERRPRDRVNEAVMQDVDAQGFGSYQQDIPSLALEVI